MWLILYSSSSLIYWSQLNYIYIYIYSYWIWANIASTSSSLFLGGKLKIFIEMNRLNQSKLHLWIVVGHLPSTLKLETFLACLARLWNTLLPWRLTCENLNLLKAPAIRFILFYFFLLLLLLLFCFWEGKLKIFMEMNRLNQSKLHLWMMMRYLPPILKLETFLVCFMVMKYIVALMPNMWKSKPLLRLPPSVLHLAEGEHKGKRFLFSFFLFLSFSFF